MGPGGVVIVTGHTGDPPDGWARRLRRRGRGADRQEHLVASPDGGCRPAPGGGGGPPSAPPTPPNGQPGGAGPAGPVHPARTSWRLCRCPTRGDWRPWPASGSTRRAGARSAPWRPPRPPTPGSRRAPRPGVTAGIAVRARTLPPRRGRQRGCRPALRGDGLHPPAHGSASSPPGRRATGPGPARRRRSPRPPLRAPHDRGAGHHDGRGGCRRARPGAPRGHWRGPPPPGPCCRCTPRPGRGGRRRCTRPGRRPASAVPTRLPLTDHRRHAVARTHPRHRAAGRDGDAGRVGPEGHGGPGRRATAGRPG